MTTQPATHVRPTSQLFVLVADARSGRLLRRLTSGALEEEWMLYSADDAVRALGQSPDTHELPAAPATPASSHVADQTFVAEIAARLGETCAGADASSILVVAPHRFVELMRTGFGSVLWRRVQHTIPRDKTQLSDASLQELVDQTLDIYG